MTPVEGLAAAASLLGSLRGGKPDFTNKQQLVINQQNADLQREFAQMGIRWRVEDAEAAGLHPLAALGMQPVQASPSYVGTDSSRGRTAPEIGAQMTNLMLAAAAMEKDHAMAEYYRAIAAKARQDPSTPVPDLGNASGWITGDGTGGGELVHQGREPGFPADLQPFFARRQVNPSQVTSANQYDKSLEAATGVAWKAYTLDRDGFQMVLPSSNSMSEALESLSESALLLSFTVAENMRRFGPQWGMEFFKRYGSALGITQ